ncbi:hypothetical protein ABEY41_19085 [Peribacillus butanolivorans]|uniref:hypothetical protein n=1 Tax=Peribacillus butanolivorans TaxID=421767 RepID=UPI003D29B16B
MKEKELESFKQEMRERLIAELNQVEDVPGTDKYHVFVDGESVTMNRQEFREHIKLNPEPIWF